MTTFVNQLERDAAKPKTSCSDSSSLQAGVSASPPPLVPPKPPALQERLRRERAYSSPAGIGMQKNSVADVDISDRMPSRSSSISSRSEKSRKSRISISSLISKLGSKSFSILKSKNRNSSSASSSSSINSSGIQIDLNDPDWKKTGYDSDTCESYYHHPEYGNYISKG